MKLEIQKSLVISTTHITKEDDKLLGNCLRDVEKGIIVDQVDYGWRVLVNSLVETGIAEIKNLGFSNGFIKCLLVGFINDCEWVHFDSDGPIYNFLQKYEW